MEWWQCGGKSLYCFPQSSCEGEIGGEHAPLQESGDMLTMIMTNRIQRCGSKRICSMLVHWYSCLCLYACLCARACQWVTIWLSAMIWKGRHTFLLSNRDVLCWYTNKRQNQFQKLQGSSMNPNGGRCVCVCVCVCSLGIYVMWVASLGIENYGAHGV